MEKAGADGGLSRALPVGGRAGQGARGRDRHPPPIRQEAGETNIYVKERTFPEPDRFWPLGRRKPRVAGALPHVPCGGQAGPGLVVARVSGFRIPLVGI